MKHIKKLVTITHTAACGQAVSAASGKYISDFFLPAVLV